MSISGSVRTSLTSFPHSVEVAAAWVSPSSRAAQNVGRGAWLQSALLLVVLVRVYIKVR